MYTPRPVPNQLSPEARAYLDDELQQISYWLNRPNEGGIVLHQSGDSTRTNSTNSYVNFEQVTVPGGLLGRNGMLMADYAVSTDVKPSTTYNFSVTVNGTLNADAIALLNAANKYCWSRRFMQNTNSDSAQTATNRYGSNPHSVYTAGHALSVDTSQDFDVYFRGRVAAADVGTVTMTLAMSRLIAFPMG